MRFHDTGFPVNNCDKRRVFPAGRIEFQVKSVFSPVMFRFFKKPFEPAPDPQFFEVSYQSETYRIQLKRLVSARRYTLRVRTATQDIVLTMPARGSMREARTFGERHLDWIAARVKRLPDAMPFVPGAVLPLRGVPHEIVHKPEQRGAVWREPGDGLAFCRLCVSGNAAHIPRRIKDYLLREAREDFEAAVHRHCANLGIPARRITLRDTTSRWGSCSATGSLNFSWRLIMAPSFVLDYLAAHEVAHLRHLNHSAAFWAVLATLTPSTSKAKNWLKAHGTDLLRYGPKRT
jgi:predicted metal-dependent hydrolase